MLVGRSSVRKGNFVDGGSHATHISNIDEQQIVPWSITLRWDQDRVYKHQPPAYLQFEGAINVHTSSEHAAMSMDCSPVSSRGDTACGKL